MANYTYKLEVQLTGIGDGTTWAAIRTGGLQYLLGYLDCASNQSPRLPHRVVRNDGKVESHFNEVVDVNIGMIAGWPSAEQYEEAARRAYGRAEAIRAIKGKHTVD
jgi:hypothetical protein